MTTPPRKNETSLIENFKRQKWVTLIALPILIVAMIEEIYWIWGLLFIYWGIYSIRNKQVYLLETIEAEEDPVLFWLLVVLWIGSGLVYVQTSLFPTLWS